MVSGVTWKEAASICHITATHVANSWVHMVFRFNRVIVSGVTQKIKCSTCLDIVCVKLGLS